MKPVLVLATVLLAVVTAVPTSRTHLYGTPEGIAIGKLLHCAASKETHACTHAGMPCCVSLILACLLQHYLTLDVMLALAIVMWVCIGAAAAVDLCGGCRSCGTGEWATTVLES